MPATPQLDLDLLRAFATVAETGSFSRAAERLLRTQSTISLQIKRLEDGIGQRLLDRTTKSVKLTARGETLLGYARQMLALGDEMVAKVAEPHLAGLVRLGTPEDFATSHLPGVLARFAQAYQEVVLEVTCDLTLNTLNLQEGFHKNELDIVLLKREAGSTRQGMRVWREPLVWAGADATNTAHSQIPLVLSPSPCVYRKRALESLDHAHRPWRMVYTSPSLAGTLAAVKAGLGISVLPKAMLTEGLRVLGEDHGLPDLPDTEIALYTRKGASKACLKLAEHIVHSLEHALG